MWTWIKFHLWWSLTFKHIKDCLVKSKRFEVLGLNELPFDIKDEKEAILEIMKANADTLVHFAMNRECLIK